MTWILLVVGLQVADENEDFVLLVVCDRRVGLLAVRVDVRRLKDAGFRDGPDGGLVTLLVGLRLGLGYERGSAMGREDDEGGGR